MKTLRQICAVTILSLTLAVSVMAGHIDTTGAPAPASSTNYSDNTGGNYDVNATITTSIVQTILSLVYG